MTRFTFLSITLLISLFNTARSQDLESLKLYYETEGDRVLVYADSYEVFPQSVKLELEYKGLRVSGQLPEYHVVPANEKKMLLVELEFTGRGKISFQYKYSFFLGDIVNSKHDNEFAYILPFRSSDAFKLTQGYFGMFSHTGKKALDFTMPEGTEIVAARGGTVIKLKEDSDLGCAKERCLEAANYLTILHDDGSHAHYFHLRQNGVVVDLGQKIEQGEHIGYSGNTGFTSGPHLHFEVTVPSLKAPETVETKFRIEGTMQLLEKGNFYKSSN